MGSIRKTRRGPPPCATWGLHKTRSRVMMRNTTVAYHGAPKGARVRSRTHTPDVNHKERAVKSPNVVSRDEGCAARKRLLVKEKELSRQRDVLSAERRKLPMVALEREYVFQGPEGRRTLPELFDGKRQLVTYHFMFGPDWGDEGGPACSYVVDNIAGSLVHLAARDTAFAAISRAPFAKIAPFKQRMGWTFPWLSSFGTDFNYDFGVTLDETHTLYNYAPVAA